jgi:phage shock protein A
MKAIPFLILLAVLLLGWFAWSKLPGLRTSVTSTVDEYGGWTEEARREDPVGFLTYAQEKLTADIEAFRESRETLAAAKGNAEVEKARNEGLLAAAAELAIQFRDAFQSAEAEEGWPVELGGARYDREQLVAQVDSILAESDSYEKVVGIYAEVIESATDQRAQLRGRIQSAEATLVELEARRELVRIDKLTAETDELLAQVDALLEGNQEILVDLDEPVRSVESLLAASPGKEREDGEGPDALEFLTKE